MWKTDFSSLKKQKNHLILTKNVIFAYFILQAKKLRGKLRNFTRVQVPLVCPSVCLSFVTRLRVLMLENTFLDFWQQEQNAVTFFFV